MSLRIVFAGTPDFAARHLAAILETNQHQVIAVYSQPDRPAGRGKRLKPSPVKALAQEHEIPVYQPLSLKESETQAELAALEADLMVVVAYGLLLPQPVLDTPRLGCINVHASLLPRWRGAAPIQRAIEAGDQQTGITIMQMDAGLDTGDMLLEQCCNIDNDETGGSLHDKLAELGKPLLNEALTALEQGKTQPAVQDDQLSNYAKKIDKADPLIDWQKAALSIEHKVRAFNPFPVVYTTQRGERIKIWLAEATGTDHIATTDAAPGTILQADKNGLIVACGESSLRLLQLQLPGSKAMPIAAILNGHAQRFSVGSLLGD